MTVDTVAFRDTVLARLHAHVSGSAVLVGFAFVVSLAVIDTLFVVVVTAVPEERAPGVTPAVAGLRRLTTAVGTRAVQWIKRVGTRRTVATERFVVDARVARSVARLATRAELVRFTFVMSLAKCARVLEVGATIFEVVARRVAPAIAVGGLGTAPSGARTSQCSMRVRAVRARRIKSVVQDLAGFACALAHVVSAAVLVHRAFVVPLAVVNAEGVEVCTAVLEERAPGVTEAIAVERLSTARVGARTGQESVDVRTRGTVAVDSVLEVVTELARLDAHVVVVTVLLVAAFSVRLAARG